MKLEHFEMLLDLRGPDISGWPAQESDAARSLLEASETARDLLFSAESLESALDSYVVAEPSAALDARLLDLAPVAKPVISARPNFLSRLFDLKVLTSAGMALASMVFGLFIGMSSVSPLTFEDEADAFVSAALGNTENNFWQEDDAG